MDGRDKVVLPQKFRFFKTVQVLEIKTVIGLLLTLFWSFLFYRLTREVWEKETLSFDVSVSEYVYKLRTSELDVFLKFITNFGGIYLVFFTIAIVSALAIKKQYLKAVWFSLPIEISFIINLILKQVVGRSRPTISQIITETDFSFPSGHSSASVIFYSMLVALIFKLTKNLTIRILSTFFFAILVLLILFSRLYLGVHYLTDIIGGAVQSLIVILLFWNISRFHKKKPFDSPINNTGGKA